MFVQSQKPRRSRAGPESVFGSQIQHHSSLRSMCGDYNPNLFSSTRLKSLIARIILPHHFRNVCALSSELKHLRAMLMHFLTNFPSLLRSSLCILQAASCRMMVSTMVVNLYSPCALTYNKAIHNTCTIWKHRHREYVLFFCVDLTTQHPSGHKKTDFKKDSKANLKSPKPSQKSSVYSKLFTPPCSETISFLGSHT